MKPSLRYTYDFVREALPTDCRAILEIGCGNGELAQLLAQAGFEVVAVDSDPDAVAAARRLGVDAQLLEWPAELGQSFDAVLFTRSLHHVHELGEAVEAAVGVLRSGGRMIVEDFRAEGGSAQSDAWFGDMVRKLCREGDVAAMLDRAKPAGDEHELHSSEAIADALAKHGPLERTDAAYYFRYIEPELADLADADALLQVELKAIASGAIDALGQRFVLSPRA